MTSQNRTLDLQNLYTGRFPFFFLSLGDHNRPIPIRRVEDGTLWVDAATEVMQRETISGFIVAKNDLGILQFSCEPLAYPIDQTKFDVLALRINAKSLKLINRREYYRLDCLTQPECALATDDHNRMMGKLINLSAGGVQFLLDRQIKISTTYSFRTHISSEEELNNIESPVFIIHEQLPDAQQKYYLYGAKFVLQKNQNAYPALAENTRLKIIQYINKSLVERNKVPENEQKQMPLPSPHAPKNLPPN